MNTRYNVVSFLLLLIATVQASAHSLPLDSDWQVGVSSRDRITSVALAYEGDLQEAVTVANSLFDPKQVRAERFCKGCDKVYLIPVADASSNYGAQTYVIAYPSGSSWKLARLPMDVLQLVKPSPAADYVLLVSDNVRYTFQQGLLVPVK